MTRQHHTPAPIRAHAQRSMTEATSPAALAHSRSSSSLADLGTPPTKTWVPWGGRLKGSSPLGSPPSPVPAGASPAPSFSSASSGASARDSGSSSYNVSTYGESCFGGHNGFPDRGHGRLEKRRSVAVCLHRATKHKPLRQLVPSLRCNDVCIVPKSVAEGWDGLSGLGREIVSVSAITMRTPRTAGHAVASPPPPPPPPTPVRIGGQQLLVPALLPGRRWYACRTPKSTRPLVLHVHCRRKEGVSLDPRQDGHSSEGCVPRWGQVCVLGDPCQT